MVRKREVGFGVIIADATNEIIEEILVVGNLSVFDIGADEVAEETTEILVTGVGEERARVGEHADETRE